MTKREFCVQYSHHENDFKKFATRLTGSEVNAEDLMQQAVIKAYIAKDRLDNVRKFKSWVNSILYNTHCTNHNKKSRRKDLIQTKGASAQFFFNKTASPNHAVNKINANEILDLCKSQKRKGYKSFKLYLHGYSYKEIAERLDISLGAVKSRIHSLRKSVQKQYNTIHS